MLQSQYLTDCCLYTPRCSTYTRLLRRKLGLTAVEEEGDRALAEDLIQVGRVTLYCLVASIL
jgi:hypothetical protein